MPGVGVSSHGLLALAPVGPDGVTFGPTTRGELRVFEPVAGRWGLAGTGLMVETAGVAGPLAAAGTNVIAAPGAGGRVRLWRWAPERAAGVKEVAAFDTEPVHGLAVSVDDRRVLAVGRVGRASPRTVRLWDVEAGKQLGTWDVTGAGFDAVALSPDGAVFAAANHPRRGVVTLFGPATGEARRALSAADDHVRFLMFLPDGSGLIGAGTAGVIHHWRLPVGEPVRPAG